MTDASSPAGLHALGEFIESILTSAYVEDGHRLSAIIVSSPDAGKSERLLEYAHTPGVQVVNDATAFGISKILGEDIAKGNIRHLIIPDLLRILGRSPQTAAEFINLLNGLCEEGLTAALTMYIRIISNEPIKCGFLTAVTADRYKTVRRWWTSIGFASRIIPFVYGYNMDDLAKAQDDVLNQRRVFKDRRIQGLKPTKVTIQIEARTKLGNIAKKVSGMNSDFTAFRSIRNVVAMAQAHALLKGRRRVDGDDIQFIESLIPFWVEPLFANDAHYFILQNLPNSWPDILTLLKDRYSQTTLHRALLELRKIGIVSKNSDGDWALDLRVKETAEEDVQPELEGPP